MNTLPMVEATASDREQALKGLVPGRGMGRVAYEKTQSWWTPKGEGRVIATPGLALVLSVVLLPRESIIQA